jgi:hypothetical protein
MEENEIQGAMVVIVLVMILVVGIVWFSHDASGIGTVSSKWTETSTSCDDDGDCTTTTYYLVQFQNGLIRKMLWGNRDWDRLHPGLRISYVAKGFDIGFLGWRIASPDIISFEVLPPPQ